MITPRFSISQDDICLTIRIHAPQASLEDVEYVLEDATFIFTAKPYYLRLTLPGELEDTELCDARFDADNQDFLIRAPKKNQGEHFKGLQMVSELLRNPVRTAASPVEVVEGSAPSTDYSSECFDWFIEQQLPPSEEEGDMICPYGYGFAGKNFGDFAPILEELGDVIDISDPGTKSPSDRRTAREQIERERFSDDHYLADLFESEGGVVLQKCLREAAENVPVYKVDLCTSGELSDEETEALKDLPRLEYLLGSQLELQSVALGLADILFAACFDSRLTEGDGNCESAWTITKVSATLSAFETFRTVPTFLRSCYRRVLVYPLYRRFELAESSHQDLMRLLKAGPIATVKVLLAIRRLFIQRDPFYIFNNLYINFYCIFVQREKPELFLDLAEAIGKVQLTKDDLGLSILELEAAGRSLLQEDCEDESSEEENAAAFKSANTEDLKAIMEELDRLTLEESRKKRQESGIHPKRKPVAETVKIIFHKRAKETRCTGGEVLDSDDDED